MHYQQSPFDHDRPPLTVPPSSPIPSHRTPSPLPLNQNFAITNSAANLFFNAQPSFHQQPQEPLLHEFHHPHHEFPTSFPMSRTARDGSSSSSSSAHSSSSSMVSFTDPRPRPSVPVSPRQRARSPPVAPTFSMGFRADCFKCVTRVPGHYSHLNTTSTNNHSIAVTNMQPSRAKSPPIVMMIEEMEMDYH